MAIQDTGAAGLLHRAEQGAWQLAAIATALRGGADGPMAAGARNVLLALGLSEDDLLRTGASPEQLAGQAAAPLLQAAAVAGGSEVAWSEQSDQALLAQGRASAQGARAFAELALPHLGDLAGRLARPDARILDVGTGVGALALAYAEAFPAARVVGIDVSERALGLAAATVAASPAGERVELRRADVAELEDEQGFDLAWVPAPFVPEPALRRGVGRVAAALRPGGWIMLGHGRYGADPVDDALNRFKTTAFGGTPLDDGEAEAMLTAAGFGRVVHAPTPPGAPAVALARRP